MSLARKQPNLHDFLNQDQNKGMFNSKSKSQNKKNKNKNTTCARQKSNNILLQKKKTRTKQIYDKKTYSKSTLNKQKNNENFYLLFIPFGHLVQESFNFQPTCGPCTPIQCAHVHPCVSHVYLCVNYERSIKNQLKFN